MAGLHRCVDCPRLTTGTRCLEHARPVRQYQRRFQTGATAYNDAAWVRAARAFKASHPFCVNAHRLLGCTLVTELVDHIVPHRGDTQLFWDMANWQPMCRHCHAIKTAAETLTADERGGA